MNRFTPEDAKRHDDLTKFVATPGYARLQEALDAAVGTIENALLEHCKPDEVPALRARRDALLWVVQWAPGQLDVLDQQISRPGGNSRTLI
jgi:hypothetical protein